VSRDPRLFLDDILTAARRIVRYTDGRERDAVFADEMRFDAVLYNLHVIGEAVKNLPEDFRRRHPDLPWREIAGMRDFIAHAYFALDLEILWDAIQNDVPALRRRVERITDEVSRAEEQPG
jgi:uncharacterized protein with HEPN domain